MKKIVKILFFPLLIIGISTAVYFYMKATKPVTEKVKASEKSWAVNAWKVSKQSLRPEIALYGVIESPYNTTVSAVIAADVTALSVLEGQKVEKGKTLIVLDPQDIGLVVKQRKADLASVKTNLRTSRKDLARQESLYKKRIISSATIDKARQSVSNLKSSMASAQARVDQIVNDASRATVVAPFSGRVTKVHVSPGDRVNMGSPLVSLYDSTNLEVRVQLPNSMLAKVRALWDSGKVVKAVIGNQKTPATLSRITGEVKANSAGIDAIFNVDKEDKALSLGRSVKLTVLLPAVEDTIFLPYEAVYNLDKIYLISEGRLERIQVKRIGQYKEKGNPYILIDARKIPSNSMVMVTQLSNAITGLKVDVATLDGVKVKKKKDNTVENSKLLDKPKAEK